MNYFLCVCVGFSVCLCDRVLQWCLLVLMPLVLLLVRLVRAVIVGVGECVRPLWLLSCMVLTVACVCRCVVVFVVSIVDVEALGFGCCVCCLCFGAGGGGSVVVCM